MENHHDPDDLATGTVRGFSCLARPVTRFEPYDLESDPDEVRPKRTGGLNDQLEKRLARPLPPTGAGINYAEPLPLGKRLGAFATRIGK